MPSSYSVVFINLKKSLNQKHNRPYLKKIWLSPISPSPHEACSAPCLAPFSCRQPPHCVPDTYSNATLWYKIFTTARDANTKYAQDYNPFWCYKGAIGKVYHALNPKLTVIVPDVSEKNPVCPCVSRNC